MNSKAFEMSQKKRNANPKSLRIDGEQRQRKENASLRNKTVSKRSSERNTKPPSWLSDYYTKISKSTFEKKTSEDGNHLEEGESSMKCNRPSKKRRIVKWRSWSWNEVYDRDNKIAHIAEEMGIPPKGTDGGYDARVLERMRNYVQNEPITRPDDDANGPRQQASPSNHDAAISVIPGCPPDVDESGPSQVPAPPQNFPLVPVPLLPAAMSLSPFLTIILQITDSQTLPLAQEVMTPTTTPELLQILPPPTVSETSSSQTTRIPRNQPYPQRFKDYFMY